MPIGGLLTNKYDTTYIFPVDTTYNNLYDFVRSATVKHGIYTLDDLAQFTADASVQDRLVSATINGQSLSFRVTTYWNGLTSTGLTLTPTSGYSTLLRVLGDFTLSSGTLTVSGSVGHGLIIYVAGNLVVNGTISMVGMRATANLSSTLTLYNTDVLPNVGASGASINANGSNADATNYACGSGGGGYWDGSSCPGATGSSTAYSWGGSSGGTSAWDAGFFGCMQQAGSAGGGVILIFCDGSVSGSGSISASGEQCGSSSAQSGGGGGRVHVFYRGTCSGPTITAAGATGYSPGKNGGNGYTDTTQIT